MVPAAGSGWFCWLRPFRLPSAITVSSSPAQSASALVGGLWLVEALRGHFRQPRSELFLSWFVGSGPPYLQGGFVDPDPRGIPSVVAAAMARISTALRYSTPEFGPVSLDQYDRPRAHFRERYRQVINLVIGDLVPRLNVKLNNPECVSARVVMVLATIVAAVSSRPAAADDRGAGGVDAAGPASS